MDPAIAKIFTLSQLGLQYLLFCTKFLDKSVSSLRENLYTYQKQNLDLQEALKQCDKELQHARKKAKKLEINSLEIYPCTKCTKNFESQLLLDSHMLRKHRESKDQDSNLINTIKLELEIKQLKEKLNTAEKKLMDAKIVGCKKCHENEKRIFKNIGIQINSEEKERDDKMDEKEDPNEKLKEFNENIRQLMSEQMKQFSEYRQNDEKRHEKEISDLKNLLDKAVESLKQNEIKQPLPLPRYHIGVQASDESSATAPASEQKNPNLITENENLWKTRFMELEKMYEHYQSQMTQSMKDMEKTYAEKMNKLEDSMKQLKSEKSRIPVSKPAVEEKEIVPRVYVKKQNETSESSSEDEIVEDLKTVKVASNSSLQKDFPIEKLINVKNLPVSKISDIEKKSKKTFSAQKWLSKNSQKHEKIEIKGDQKREKAEKLFNDRMKEFDIDKHENHMNLSKADEINSKLANRREKQKRIHPRFFINRKTIKAKVDELFERYTQKNERTLIKQESMDDIQKVSSKDQDDKPKKKVLFNLNQHFKPQIKSKEDSDFDITSLEEDMK